MTPPSGFAREPQASYRVAIGRNNSPLPIESLNEFYLGPREGLKVTVTQPGDHARGFLDYGTVTGPQGITFTGYIAAVRHQYIIPELELDPGTSAQPKLALDQGTLTQPDGRVLTGDFSITFPERTVLSFSQIPQGT